MIVTEIGSPEDNIFYPENKSPEIAYIQWGIRSCIKDIKENLFVVELRGCLCSNDTAILVLWYFLSDYDLDILKEIKEEIVLFLSELEYQILGTKSNLRIEINKNGFEYTKVELSNDLSALCESKIAKLKDTTPDLFL